MSNEFTSSLHHLQQLTEFDILQDDLVEMLVEGDYPRIMNRLHISGILPYISDPHFIRMYTYMKNACENPSDFEEMSEENHHQTCTELAENVISSMKKDVHLFHVVQALLGSYECNDNE